MLFIFIEMYYEKQRNTYFPMNLCCGSLLVLFLLFSRTFPDVIRDKKFHVSEDASALSSAVSEPIFLLVHS